jgi:hypothetical protein
MSMNGVSIGNDIGQELAVGRERDRIGGRTAGPFLPRSDKQENRAVEAVGVPLLGRCIHGHGGTGAERLAEFVALARRYASHPGQTFVGQG